MLNKIPRILREEGMLGVLHRVLMVLFRSKVSLLKVLRQNTVTSRYGIRLSINWNDATFDHYITGKYGFYYWNRLSNIDTNFIFLDIGANQGLYTICASLNPKNVKCYAFEPVQETFDYLVKNVELNEVEEKCQLIKKAVSDKVAVTNIKLTSGNSGAASLAATNNPDPFRCRRIDIETIDGKSLWEILGQIEAPIFVKIDVEGYELIVIKQLLSSSKASNIKEIYYEVDEKWSSLTEAQSILEEYGFTVFEKFKNGWHYDVLAKRQ